MKKITSFLIVLFCLVCQLSTAQVPQLWGMTENGGKYYNGNIFNINGDGSDFQNLYSFPNSAPYAANPTGDLLLAKNDILYGMTSYGGSLGDGVIFSYDPNKDLYKIVADSFGSSGSLIQLNNGSLCGLNISLFIFDTLNNACNIIYNFSSGNYPVTNIMQASDGKLYGMSTGNGGHPYPAGNLYSFDLSDSVYTVVHVFDTIDGAEPYYGKLVQASNGKLYGMASEGGINNYGVIFSFDIYTGTYTKLYYFALATGATPWGSLIQATDGKLYGMTIQGGRYGYSAGFDNGFGVIFSFDLSDSTYTDLYDFKDSTIGINPEGDLIQASDSNLYGMTYGGIWGSGNVFKFNPKTNTYTNLYAFTNQKDGAYPVGDLTEVTTVPASINQLSANNNQLSIYPNPSGGAFAIKSTKTIDALKVTNLMGQVILKSPLGDLGVTQFTFNISATGMYFVTVTSDNETETKKVLVIK